MTQTTKTTLIILAFAFVGAIFIHCALVMILSRNPIAAVGGNLGLMRPVCYALAAAGILGAVYWAMNKMPTAPNIQRFQTDMILALALSEVACIMGLLLFFLEHKPATFWPFAIAALITDVVIILPRVLQRS